MGLPDDSPAVKEMVQVVKVLWAYEGDLNGREDHFI